eukprot:m51a1_g14422 putative protein kinase domain containing protein (916) ;mRNA; f:489138-493017
MRAHTCAAAAALLALRAACALAQCYGVGATPEAYDEFHRDDVTDVAHLAAPRTPGTCTLSAADRLDGSAMEVVQLFTPRSVPWKYTMLCFRGWYNGTFVDPHAIPLQAVMYAADVATGAPARVPPLATAATTVRSTGDWTNVAVSFDVAYPRVYLGLRVLLPCADFYLNAYVFQPGRASYYRHANAAAGASEEWSLSLVPWVTNASFVSLRAQGVAGQVPPPGWVCTAARYNDSRCDCGCGVWDPDCRIGRAGPLSSNCSDGEVCNRSGQCQRPGWDVSVCRLESFGSGDGCQCGCKGALDPDCRDTDIAGGPWYPQAAPCPGINVAMCAADGTCADAWSDDPAGRAAHDGLCHCRSSGVMDPDCLCVDDYSALNCSYAQSTCGASRCYMGGCRASIASGWTCSIKQIGNPPQCDCNCGGFDPDCLARQNTIDVTGCGPAGSRSPYVCARNGTCVAQGCGNGVLEGTDVYQEDCDSGAGCHLCKCRPGWLPTDPPSVSCRTVCGDDIFVGAEQCDGGMFCFEENCTCWPGHAPYAPRRSGCVGCGNGVLDANESCDSGTGCHPSLCVCTAGYAETTPRTTACLKVPYACGDHAVQGSEQCDAGAFCSGCACDAGHAPYSPRRPSCTGCGNGLLDAGEDCDGGNGCNASECRCSSGFMPTTPPTIGCVPYQDPCGDGVARWGEECDGGALCGGDCRCVAGSVPYSPPEQACAGCPNGVLDAGELCDGGPGCGADCRCVEGHVASTPPWRGCRSASAVNGSAAGSGNLGVAVGVPVGVFVVVTAAAAMSVVAVYLTRKRRRAPALVLGDGDGQSGAGGGTAGQRSPSGVETCEGAMTTRMLSGDMGSVGSLSVGHWRSHAPDGTPIIVVPVKPGVAPQTPGLASGASTASVVPQSQFQTTICSGGAMPSDVYDDTHH